jgi:RNA polymerase sigma-70 factor (ECF subfamily)
MQNAESLERPVSSSLRLPFYGRLSDADLVRRANDGDGRAVEALVERYSARVSRIASHILADVEDARDAAQESLLKLTTRLRQFRGDCQFSTWLHRLVVNTCRDLADRQRLRRAEALPYVEEPDDDSDPSRLAMLADLRLDVRSALSRLTVDQRRVVVLRDGLGLSYEEISRRLRIPVGTAKSYVHRARKGLHARLQQRGGS